MTTTAATGMPAEDDPPDPANDDHHLYEDFTYNYNPEDYDENFTISVEELLSVLDDPQPNDGARSPSKPNDSTENSISLQDGKYEVSGPPKDPMDAHFFLSGEHGYLQNYLDISSYDEGTLGGYVDVSGTSRKFTNTCSPGNESDVINSHVGDQYHEIHDVSSVVLSTLDLGIRTEACAEDAHSKFTNLANYNVGNSEKEESVYTGDNLSKVEVEPTEEMMTSDTKKYGGSDPSMTSLDKLGYFSGEDDRFHRELVQDPPNLGGKFCMSPSLESNSNCIESCSTGDSSNNISTEAANAHYSMQYLQTPVLASSSFEDSFEASMFLDEKDGKPCPFGRLYMENQADLDTIACSFKEPAKNVNIKHNVNYYEDMNFKNPFVPESSSLLGVPSSSEFIGHGVDDTKYLGLGELIPRFWRKDQLENGLSSLQHDCSFDEAIPLDIRQNSAVNNDAAKHILNNENTLEDLTFPTIQERFHNIKPREYIGSSYPEVSTSWSKAHDERLTFRIALQDLSQPTSEANPPDGVLAVPLLRHQRIALSWMVQKETCSLNCFGGILADDQGLGKTVSTIALILAERPPLTKKCKDDAKAVKIETLSLDDDDDGSESVGINRSRSSDVLTVQKPKRDNIYTSLGRPAAGTLVVCPTSVLRQWAEELQTKVTSKGNLSFLLYHGSNRTKDPNELSKYDVVLTTYSIVSMEVPKQLYCKDDEDKGRSDIHLSVASSSRKRKHQSTNDSRISNGRTKTDVTLLEANARPLAKVAWFRVILDEAQTIKNHRTHVARACCGLRAKRRWCLSGTPIQNAVDDLYSYFRFLRYEPYAEYISFCSTIKTPISKNPTIGYKKLQAVLKTIMLRRTKGTYIDGEPIINLPPKSINLTKVDFSLEERSFYSRLEAESREQFKVYADAGTLKQNYVNILLMLLRLRQACDHPHLVQGCDSNSSWMASLENAKRLPNDKQLHLLNCLEACLAICTICNDPPENAVVTICGHVFCHQCIQGHLTGDDSKCPSRHCDSKLDALSIFSKDSLKIVVSAPGDGIPPDRSRYKLPSGRDVGCTDSSKIRTVMKILQSLPKLDSYVKTSYTTHNQPNHCSENGYDCQITEKAIVFSQWTRMLDLLEIQLKSSSLKYRRLDGTMSVASRDKAIKDFNTHPEVTVMIMSLKAASLGLNMVSACHVILLDLWWNPTTEDQAIDRAHRIGQTRPVTVSRLTVKDTVEDRILALQEKKREMVSSVFGEDEAAGRQTRLTVDDLRYLFMA